MTADIVPFPNSLERRAIAEAAAFLAAPNCEFCFDPETVSHTKTIFAALASHATYTKQGSVDAGVGLGFEMPATLTSSDRYIGNDGDENLTCNIAYTDKRGVPQKPITGLLWHCSAKPFATTHLERGSQVILRGLFYPVNIDTFEILDIQPTVTSAA
jgi:hypothetical protein